MGAGQQKGSELSESELNAASKNKCGTKKEQEHEDYVMGGGGIFSIGKRSTKQEEDNYNINDNNDEVNGATEGTSQGNAHVKKFAMDLDDGKNHNDHVITDKQLKNSTPHDLKQFLTQWIQIHKQNPDMIAQAATMMDDVFSQDLNYKRDSGVIHPIENDEKLLKLVLKWYEKKHNYDVSKDDEELAILLTTGSLNPIHTGHIDMMNYAKKELESYKEDSKKYTVIGGFMSPSHDEYVSRKESYIRSNNRVEMIKMAVKDSNWIECDEWECKQKNFNDFPVVCQEFSKEINSEEFSKKIVEYIGNNYMNENNGKTAAENINMDYNKISLFYVCGRDHCDKCGLWNGIYRNNRLVGKTLVVPRPDNNNNNNNIKSENCIVVNVPESKMIDDRSSTQVRKYIKYIKEEIFKMKILHPNVLKYILNQDNLNELYKQLNDKNYKSQL